MFLLINGMLSEHCDSSKDCLEDTFCNSNHMCEHKPLFPLSKRDSLLALAIFITSIVFSPVCVGGEKFY